MASIGAGLAPDGTNPVQLQRYFLNNLLYPISMLTKRSFNSKLALLLQHVQKSILVLVISGLCLSNFCQACDRGVLDDNNRWGSVPSRLDLPTQYAVDLPKVLVLPLQAHPLTLDPEELHCYLLLAPVQQVRYFKFPFHNVAILIMSTTPFVTAVKDNPVQDSYDKLGTYINNMQSKLNYAEFKQRIVLLQNYEPLGKIIRRTKMLKQEHQERFNVDQEGNDLQLLDHANYINKLEKSVSELKSKVRQFEVDKELLTAEIEERRETLKALLKTNRDILCDLFQNRKGIAGEGQTVLARHHQKQRSRSYSSLKEKSLSTKTLVSAKTKRGRTETSSTVSRFLYSECLDKLTKSIHQMNSSLSIQGGIFLDILELEEKKPRKNQSANLMYEVLMNSYKSQQTKNSSSNEPELSIEWQTFQKFNGKQILGLVLMKERSLEILKRVPQRWSGV